MTHRGAGRTGLPPVLLFHVEHDDRTPPFQQVRHHEAAALAGAGGSVDEEMAVAAVADIPAGEGSQKDRGSGLTVEKISLFQIGERPHSRAVARGPNHPWPGDERVTRAGQDRDLENGSRAGDGHDFDDERMAPIGDRLLRRQRQIVSCDEGGPDVPSLEQGAKGERVIPGPQEPKPEQRRRGGDKSAAADQQTPRPRVHRGGFSYLLK